MASNISVKREPFLAHGGIVAFTPCSAHLTRGTGAVMLEEVEVSPSSICEVVHLAEFAAVRAGKLRTAICLDFQFKAMRIDAELWRYEVCAHGQKHKQSQNAKQPQPPFNGPAFPEFNFGRIVCHANNLHPRKELVTGYPYWLPNASSSPSNISSKPYLNSFA